MLVVKERKRMRSGDRPGLQNRRAAGILSPVCSTHTRFRQLSITYRLRNHSEISSRGQVPCERPSSELAPSHPSPRRRRHSSWCGCPRASAAFAGRRLAFPLHQATSGRCVASCDCSHVQCPRSSLPSRKRRSLNHATTVNAPASPGRQTPHDGTEVTCLGAFTSSDPSDPNCVCAWRWACSTFTPSSRRRSYPHHLLFLCRHLRLPPRLLPRLVLVEGGHRQLPTDQKGLVRGILVVFCSCPMVRLTLGNLGYVRAGVDLLCCS